MAPSSLIPPPPPPPPAFPPTPPLCAPTKFTLQWFRASVFPRSQNFRVRRRFHDNLTPNFCDQNQTWGRVHFHEYEYIGDWRVHLWWMSTSTFYTSTSTFPWVFSRMMTYTIIQAITRTNSHTSIVAYTYPVRACMHSFIHNYELWRYRTIFQNLLSAHLLKQTYYVEVMMIIVLYWAGWRDCTTHLPPRAVLCLQRTCESV